MTLDDIARMKKEVLSPAEIAPILGCNPYTLNVAAKLGRLSIPHFFSGSRLKILRRKFLEFMGYAGDEPLKSAVTESKISEMLPTARERRAQGGYK